MSGCSMLLIYHQAQLWDLHTNWQPAVNSVDTGVQTAVVQYSFKNCTVQLGICSFDFFHVDATAVRRVV